LNLSIFPHIGINWLHYLTPVTFHLLCHRNYIYNIYLEQTTIIYIQQEKIALTSEKKNANDGPGDGKENSQAVSRHLTHSADPAYRHHLHGN
jgi:hypothetical protein